MSVKLIPIVAGQTYAPWIDPSKAQELQQGTLWGDTSNWFVTQFTGFCSWAWQCAVHYSLHIAIIGCVILVLYYVFTRDKRCIKGCGFITMTYILIETINKAIG